MSASDLKLEAPGTLSMDGDSNGDGHHWWKQGRNLTTQETDPEQSRPLTVSYGQSGSAKQTRISFPAKRHLPQ